MDTSRGRAWACWFPRASESLSFAFIWLVDASPFMFSMSALVVMQLTNEPAVGRRASELPWQTPCNAQPFEGVQYVPEEPKGKPQQTKSSFEPPVAGSVARL